MQDDSKEYKNLQITDNNGNKTSFNATVYNDKKNKPCAVVLTESKENTGQKLSDVSDKAMSKVANGFAHTSQNLKSGDKLYAFAENKDGTFRQQPFELQVKGSMHDQSASERSMSPYSKNTGSDHKPLESIHKERMELTVSKLQGKNILAENKMPSIDREAEQRKIAEQKR